MRTYLVLMIAALALAPLAAAEENTSRPDDAAWTEDCPPDMMCAAGGPECTTAEDGTQMCPDEPQEFGPEGCIECSGPAPDQPVQTCMDGSAPADACDPNVQYLDGRGPPDCENCRSDTSGEPTSAPSDGANPEVMTTDKNDVPAPAVAGVSLAVGAAAIALIARRR